MDTNPEIVAKLLLRLKKAEELLSKVEPQTEEIRNFLSETKTWPDKLLHSR